MGPASPPSSPLTSRPAAWRRWWLASRPRTLPMAVTPVVVGAALAWADGATPQWLVLAMTFVCAALIQVGTNLLNDVADFEKGNDTAARVGPLRITAAGWATPAEVRRAAWISFGTATLFGCALVAVGGWPILALGVGSIVAAWAYSGGRRPLSYGAFGELFVLAFFGIVAVSGTYYLQAGHWSPVGIPTGVAVGAMAAAALLLNNYRDLAADAAAGRRTLAALLGPARSRALYAALVLGPLLLPAWLAATDGRRGAWLALLAAPLLASLVPAMRRAQGVALNSVLGRTALAQFAFGGLLAVGLLLA